MAKRAVYTVGVLMVREDQGYLMTTGLIAQSEEDAIEKGVAWVERSYPPSEGYFVSHIAVANICETSIISEMVEQKLDRKIELPSEDERLIM
jgi:hypothetical protein